MPEKDKSWKECLFFSSSMSPGVIGGKSGLFSAEWEVVQAENEERGRSLMFHVQPSPFTCWGYIPRLPVDA